MQDENNQYKAPRAQPPNDQDPPPQSGYPSPPPEPYIPENVDSSVSNTTPPGTVVASPDKGTSQPGAIPPEGAGGDSGYSRPQDNVPESQDSQNKQSKGVIVALLLLVLLLLVLGWLYLKSFNEYNERRDDRRQEPTINNEIKRSP